MDRHEFAGFDAGGDAAFAQPLRRPETGRVVVARDIEAAQHRGRGQVEGGEVVGRECRDHRQRRQHRFERQHGLHTFAGGEDPRLREGRLGSTEANAIAEQVAERAARIGKRRLVGPPSIKPGALDAGGIDPVWWTP